MFEQLGQVELRFEEVGQSLTDPVVLADNEQYTKLMKEYRQLQPIVDTYRAYCAANDAKAQAKMLLEESEPTRSSRSLPKKSCASRMLLLSASARSCVFYCCRATPTTTKTLSLRSVPVPVARKPRYLRELCFVCTVCMPIPRVGRPKPSTRLKPNWAVTRKSVFRSTAPVRIPA